MFFLMIPAPPRSPLFPYTSLFRSAHLTDALWRVESAAIASFDAPGGLAIRGMGGSAIGADLAAADGEAAGCVEARYGVRKSTRLNSSHLVISYAAFCLDKSSLAVL